MSDCEPHRDRERESKKLALVTDKRLDWLQQLQSVYMYVCTYIYVYECEYFLCSSLFLLHF